jgi:hypothetical protein
MRCSSSSLRPNAVQVRSDHEPVRSSSSTASINVRSAAFQQQRFVGAVGMPPAVDAFGVLFTPWTGEWRDPLGHTAAGAGLRPRTRRPGRSAVGTPFSAMIAPDTTVAT